jgi:hypothetical protein
LSLQWVCIDYDGEMPLGWPKDQNLIVFKFSELRKRRHDIQHNDIHHNGTQHKDTRYNDTQHKDTRYNDTQHKDIQHNDTQHNNG